VGDDRAARFGPASNITWPTTYSKSRPKPAFSVACEAGCTLTRSNKRPRSRSSPTKVIALTRLISIWNKRIRFCKRAVKSNHRRKKEQFETRLLVPRSHLASTETFCELSQHFLKSFVTPTCFGGVQGRRCLWSLSGSFHQAQRRLGFQKRRERLAISVYCSSLAWS